MPADLGGRTILVTGASRGIGRACALEAAARGADLVLVARTRGALEEVDDLVRARGRHATLVVLDLRDGAKLDALGASLFQRRRQLEGLIHAAGTLTDLTPVAHLDPARLLDLVTVHALAAQRLLRTLFPLLAGADRARAVFLTDRQGRNAAYWGHYAAGKAALEQIVRAFAAETRGTAIRTSLVDPGPVATGLRRVAFPGRGLATERQPEEVAVGIVDQLDPDREPRLDLRLD